MLPRALTVEDHATGGTGVFGDHREAGALGRCRRGRITDCGFDPPDRSDGVVEAVDMSEAMIGEMATGIRLVARW